MSKSVLKRLEKVERKLKEILPLKWLVTIKEPNGLYSEACVNEITHEQYSSWLSQQGENNQLILVEITENKPQNPAGEDLAE